MTYSAYVTTAGDVFSHASVVWGQYTQAASNSYSGTQVGSLTAPVFVPLDKSTSFKVSVDRQTKKVTAEVFSDNQPALITFDEDACTAQTY